ncbi:hypothetical protein [Candidatus Deianiraea vastatrix]|uniref:Uncharacterized protein n=1 Tax=Candidatus Deianiraea vastatrix TaxID=2163644 RepID=A0A5B8XED1_9RICK|nr:hypothetical protein [Candidatus Deianiraea vastatrix]QED23600.1 hypothetical protein Deia_00812 [Candidatus Deianiraea vastatrix]
MAKNKQKEVFILFAMSDTVSYLIHLNEGEIVKTIEEKVVSYLKSEIGNYIAKYPKVPLKFYFQDSAVKIELKHANNLKIAKHLLETAKKVKNAVYSISSLLTKSKVGKQAVVLVKLEKPASGTNLAEALNIAISCKNKVIEFNSAIFKINSFFRVKYRIPQDQIFSFGIYQSGESFMLCVFHPKIVLYTKRIKLTEEDNFNIDEEVRKLEQYGKAEYQKDVGVSSHIPKTVLISDDPSVIPPRYSNDIDVIVDTTYSDPSIHINLMAYILMKANNFTSANIVKNANISIKNGIVEFYKRSIRFFIVALIVSLFILSRNIILYRFLMSMDMERLEKDKKMISDSMSDSIMMSNADVIEQLDDVVSVWDVYSAQENWHKVISDLSHSINSKTAQVSGYKWNCGEKCLVKDGKSWSVDLSVDIGNESGYIHALYYKINDIRHSLNANYGKKYDFSGLDFKYKFNTEKKYFRKNIVINVKEVQKSDDKGGMKEEAPKEKADLEEQDVSGKGGKGASGDIGGNS